jgi:uncharacterized protein YmfQ (DUF2313 family)
MATPLYTDDEFTQQLVGMLPRGRAWPRDLDAVVRSTFKGCAPSFSRSMARGNNLLVDGFPATAVELLPEWEGTLGLPDPCAGLAPTIPQRQAAVVVRFATSGGQQAQHYIDVAAALGFPITITQFTPFRVGMRVGGRLGGADWAYAWQVNAPLYGIQPFRVGENRAGDRLATFGNAVLECELNAIKPAHTILIFSYT